ncbi:hypothetical protein BVRB_5g116740 [Beta vulgaris subsp. vulgaris]|nr:hypothetical protein BVRB_5g116740 [Beta vulgaris subsp. vulgaris]
MVRQREVEEWAKNHQIPAELQKRLRQTVRSDMRALRGLDDDTMLSLLPMDLQYDLRRHLYFDRACNLPFFANLDHEVVHSFAGHLRSFTCYKDTYVVIEGEPVKSILLFFNGELEMSSIGGGSSECASLGVGDLCGSELLAWALLPSASIQNLPCSSQSVKCLTDVEAFCIFAEDLKLLGVQFNYCSKFQQALRWHS